MNLVSSFPDHPYTDRPKKIAKASLMFCDDSLTEINLLNMPAYSILLSPYYLVAEEYVGQCEKAY